MDHAGGRVRLRYRIEPTLGGWHIIDTAEQAPVSPVYADIYACYRDAMALNQAAQPEGAPA